MWEEQEDEEGEDDDEEDEGLAGQLLSDLIASNKYGNGIFPASYLYTYIFFHQFLIIMSFFVVFVYRR